MMCGTNAHCVRFLFGVDSNGVVDGNGVEHYARGILPLGITVR